MALSPEVAKDVLRKKTQKPTDPPLQPEAQEIVVMAVSAKAERASAPERAAQKHISTCGHQKKHRITGGHQKKVQKQNGQGRLSLLDKPTRRNGRREGATLDAHRRSWKLTLASRGRRRRAPSGQDQVDKHRVGKLAGPGTDDGHRTGHSGSSGEVARPLSDIARPPQRVC